MKKEIMVNQNTINRVEIRLFALRRSGSHPVMNWIGQHFEGPVCFLNDVVPFKDPFKYQNAMPMTYDSGFLTCYNKKPNDIRMMPKDCLMFNFEDFDIQKAHDTELVPEHDRAVGKSAQLYNVLVLRDPFNTFASRMLRRRWWSDVSSEAISLWKKYAREFIGQTSFLGKSKVVVNFNEWFQSVAYRKRISSTFGLPFTDKGLQSIPLAGEASSVDGLDFNGEAQQMKVLERWKLLVHDEKYLELFEDNELIDLSNQIFGPLEVTKMLQKGIRIRIKHKSQGGSMVQSNTINPDLICSQAIQAKLNVYQAKEHFETVLKAYNDQVGNLTNLVGLMKNRIIELEGELERTKANKKAKNKDKELVTK